MVWANIHKACQKQFIQEDGRCIFNGTANDTIWHGSFPCSLRLAHSTQAASEQERPSELTRKSSSCNEDARAR